MKAIQIRHLVVALVLAAAAPFAWAVFQPGMNVEQAEAEIKLQRASGATLAQIVQRAQATPLNAGLITTALINAGFDAADVVTAMLRAGAPIQVVVNAALAAGASTAAIRQGALAAGISLGEVQAAIDASPANTEIATSSTGSSPTGAIGAGGGGGGSRGTTTTTCTAASASSC
jgi:hypothetical protein